MSETSIKLRFQPYYKYTANNIELHLKSEFNFYSGEKHENWDEIFGTNNVGTNVNNAHY